MSAKALKVANVKVGQQHNIDMDMYNWKWITYSYTPCVNKVQITLTHIPAEC